MDNNSQNSSQYDTNINNTRVNNSNQTGLNINQNPYINQTVNQAPVTPITNQQNTILNGDFVKGALIGAALTYILTNKNAQENIFKVFEKGKDFISAGVEELKERIEDAKASANSSKEF